MVSKFSQFLNDQGIDARRLISASKFIEKLRPEDRKIRLERRQARAQQSPTDEKKIFPKTRSGRPVTRRNIDDALQGRPLPAAVKTRILRAVNRVLEQKKRSAVSLRDLF